MRIGLIRPGLGIAGATLVGGSLLFGTDLFSYFRTSAGAVRETVRDAVPVEFELQRARDLIGEVLPEIHANVRLIAEDEVEIAALEADIDQSRTQIAEDRRHLSRLRDALKSEQPVYRAGSRDYTPEQLTEAVAGRFARLKDAEMILASRVRLLETRRDSLNAAVQMLDRAKNRKAELEQKIESLIAQHRLLQAETVGTRVQVSDSKLSKADRLLSDIQKRLQVSERMLRHEAVPDLDLAATLIDSDDLIAEVDAHLAGVDPIAQDERD